MMTLTDKGGEEGFALTANSAGGGSASDDHTNSCNKLDARIYVDHKEPLVSASPEVAGFYDSCLPVSLRGRSHSSMEGEVFEENTHPGYTCSGLALPPSHSAPEQLSAQTSCSGGDRQKSSLGLIDLADSPALETCRKSGDRRQQRSFSNDMFLEDLDTADVGGLDKVQISYPSKNPFLPLPFPLSSENSRLSDAGYLPTQQQGNQLLCQTVSHHRRHELYMHQDQHKTQLAELSLFVSADSKPAHHSQSRQPACQSEVSTASAKGRLYWEAVDLLPCSGGHHLPHRQLENPLCENTSVPRQSQSQPQHSFDRISLELTESSSTSLIGTGSFEMETSFIKKKPDPLPDKQTRRETGPDSVGTCPSVAAGLTFSGKSVAAAKNYLTVPDSGLPSGTVGERDWAAGETDVVVGEVCGGEAAELGEPFLLVLGGRMEKAGSVHPKPIAVWKGVFL